MISWYFWRALQRPFRLAWMWERMSNLNADEDAAWRKWLRRWSRRIFIVIGVLVIIASIRSGTFFSLLFTFLIIVLMGFSTFFFLASNLFGLNCTVLVARTIATNESQKRYEFISMTPLGKLGLGLLTCSITYSYHRSMKSMRLYLVGIFGVVGLGSVLFFPFLLDDPLLLLYILGVLAFVYLDVAQTTVLGCMIGMLLPTFTRDRLAAESLGFGVFLLVQVLFYIMFAISITLIPNIDNGLLDLGIGLLAYFVFREALVLSFWQWVLRRTRTAEDEIGHVMRSLDMRWYGMGRQR